MGGRPLQLAHLVLIGVDAGLPFLSLSLLLQPQKDSNIAFKKELNEDTVSFSDPHNLDADLDPSKNRLADPGVVGIRTGLKQSDPDSKHWTCALKICIREIV